MGRLLAVLVLLSGPEDSRKHFSEALVGAGAETPRHVLGKLFHGVDVFVGWLRRRAGGEKRERGERVAS
jgi:hypothetical protein